MSRLVLIDYGSGNVHSAERALSRVADQSGARHDIRLTADPDAVRRADRLVLPGVGHFGDCMAALAAREGLVEALEETVMDKGRPFLGICVGMQMMADFSLEDGEHRGLGWLHGAVVPLEPGPGRRIPHMGWNELVALSGHPLLEGLGEDPHAYFVHSYQFSPEDETQVVASTEDHGPIVAAVARDNLFGTQFHPEKSQATGLALLANFMRWDP